MSASDEFREVQLGIAASIAVPSTSEVKKIIAGVGNAAGSEISS